MDYQQNLKYFGGDKNENTNAGAYTLIILGVFTLALYGLGLILIGLGCMMLGKSKDSGISDEVIDNSARQKLKGLQERALNKLGIDEDEIKEVDPIKFEGYSYTNASYIKLGKDDKYRSNLYETIIFFFSKNEIYCYKYIFSLIKDYQLESTDVYFYKDIVSVSTQTDGASIKDGASVQTQQNNSPQFNYESFKLTTTGGTSITCSIRNDEVEDAQRSIKGMRSLIKEKKSA